jgi:hypothetical protein
MSTHAEAHATSEVLAPAIALNIETVEMRGAERPNFAHLGEAAQEDYNDSHPSYFNRVRQGERSVVMATTADEGHDWADSLATSTVSEVVAAELDSHHFDGASEDDAIALMRRAVGASNAELRMVKAEKDRDPNWLTAEANVSAIRFFRDEEGRQKAVISNSGSNRILKSTLDGTEVVLDAMVDSLGSPVHTVAGSPSGAMADVKVVSVRPGERFIIVDSKLGEDRGPNASVADIDAVGGRKVTDNAAGAAADIADIPEHREEDAGYGSRIGDSTTVVVDVQEQRDWNRAEKLLRMPTRAFVGMQIRAQDRRVRNREAYLENPTLRRRLLATVDMGTVAAVGFFGYKAVSALVGLGHGGGGNTVQDALLHNHSASPSPNASSSNPFDNLTQSSSSPSTSPDYAPGNTSTGAPLSTTEVPTPGAAPSIDLEHLDPNHLPAGVKLTDAQVKWLESSHSEGAIGAYNSDAGTDGLGNHGTVWHNSMESLKHAGYDPSKMSTDEKKAYVQHILDLNHLTWDQAAEEGDNFKPVMPTNQDIFSSMTHITAGHEGGPLMPSANSDMGHHLHDIKGTVEAQIAGPRGSNPGGVDGTQPSGRVPTDNGTPVTSHPTTTAPTTHPTSHPAPTASADAAASSGVPESILATNNWLENHETPILASIATVGALGVGAAAVHIARNRNKVTVTGGEGFELEEEGGLPEFLRNKADAGAHEDEDDDEDEVIVERHSTGGPSRPGVRPAAPGGRYGFIPPAPRA